jgi:hypothetical protein
MNIQPISPSDDAQLEKFYELARQVYAADPAWAHQSDLALRPLLARTSSLFVQPLLCIQGDTALARSVAIMYPRVVNTNGQHLGYIGFFECLPQYPEAGGAVLAHAEMLLRAKGAAVVHAPRVDNMLMGLVVDGFQLPQTILTPHNPPYYLDIFLESGYQVSELLHTYIFDHRSAISLPLSLPGFKTRTFNRQSLEDEIGVFHKLQKEIFQSHAGWVPRTLDEDRQMILGLLPMLDDDLLIIAETKNKHPVGLLVCLPDMYQAARGQVIDNARLISIGVLAQFAKKGLGVLMSLHLARNLISKGYNTLEASWIRDTNLPPQNLARRFLGKQGREFALLEKIIA